MLPATVACLPIFFTGLRMARRDCSFFGYFLACTGYVILAAAEHDAREPFGAVMLRFVIPLTIVTLGMRALRARRQPAG